MKKAIVIRKYDRAYSDPIKLKSGDTVKVLEKSCEWKGWKWCTDSGEKSGWVPERYLKMLDGSAIVLQDYDSTELSVRKGEKLKVVKEESGWYWCIKDDGESGWVPSKSIK